MQLIHQYPIIIHEWRHLTPNNILGHYSSLGLIYIFGISPQDHNNPTGYYFNVGMELKFDNSTGNFFFAKTTATFLVSIQDTNKPTPQQLFDLVVKANILFADKFREETKETTLVAQQIDHPDLDNLHQYLDKCIEGWNNNIRYLSHN